MELLDWDARSYEALPLPHRQWGARTVGQLELAGDETVLDLGCGTGRDAERLLDRLPEGRVVAVDGSAQMLAELRTRLAGRLDRVEVLQADLREPLPLSRPVDAALSVATLHWLPDHDAVFATVAGALRPDGRFVADAGGAGNIAGFRTALRDVTGADGAEVWNFATAEETTERLERAGFTEVEARLVPDPARLERGEQLEAFIATVLLGAQLRGLPSAQRRPLVRAVAARLPEPVIDYVRLRISAVRR
ncbi:MAG TPA: methyltransferase domain-containing protein [Mycobacteriales bacterium]|nr:methyltransferase domain-containing protein [Mycobacteriales bacterium]